MIAILVPDFKASLSSLHDGVNDMTFCVYNFRQINALSTMISGKDIRRQYESKITSTFCHKRSIYRRGDAFTIGGRTTRM